MIGDKLASDKSILCAVYIHYDIFGVPFYVGTSVYKKRPFNFKERSIDWKDKSAKGFFVVIKCVVQIYKAHMIERRLIAKLKRVCDGGTLVNKSIGISPHFAPKKSEYNLPLKNGNKNIFIIPK